MKIIPLALALAFAATQLASAQEQMTHEPGPHQHGALQ